ncbi:MAG: murein L,D-transpeptidase [Chloroflexi bacterium]|nr:MAG: murein L,D-transpeptidase [Chloroflexota bacterium]
MKKLIRFGLITTILGAALLWQGSNLAYAAKCYSLSAATGFVCESDPPEPTFVKPDPFADSFLPYVTYARLADNANVYAGPSYGSGVVRNVGDGFLFSTIQGVVEGENGLWYVINFDEFVHESDLRLVDDSEFTGFEIKHQVERPFGWMVVDYWYSNEPGAEPAPGNIKLPRYTFFEVYDAVEADDGWIWYNIGGGRWMRQTYVSLIDPQSRPEEVGEDEYWVEIDLYEQSFAAYVGDHMVYAGLVSSGLNRWPTNEGLFQVWERHSKTKMSGAEGKVDYYFVEDVPHTMYFDVDIALHGAYWHDRFGYKHSHGCVNMPPRDAEWVFNWSAGAPNDLWVWVHTSNPGTIFERYDEALGDFAGP